MKLGNIRTKRNELTQFNSELENMGIRKKRTPSLEPWKTKQVDMLNSKLRVMELGTRKLKDKEEINSLS